LIGSRHRHESRRSGPGTRAQGHSPRVVRIWSPRCASIRGAVSRPHCAGRSGVRRRSRLSSSSRQSRSNMVRTGRLLLLW
jgi:hypothetical protein